MSEKADIQSQTQNAVGTPPGDRRWDEHQGADGDAAAGPSRARARPSYEDKQRPPSTAPPAAPPHPQSHCREASPPAAPETEDESLIAGGERRLGREHELEQQLWQQCYY